MTEQFDLFAAREARDKALKQVEDNSINWMNSAIIMLVYADWGQEEYTGEDIRREITALVGSPHHHNAWGAFIRTCIKRGLLQRTGKWVNMTGEKSHARMTPVYKVRPRA